jgi:membrane protein required for colicin V production
MEWPTLGWVDLAMLGVVALSAVVGAMRGLTLEVLSLLGWVAAWFAGLWLGPLLEPHISVAPAGSALNAVVAFACAFLIVLVLWGLAARGVSALVGKTLLRPLDRLLGAVFGVARGVLVLLAVAAVISYTPASASSAWRESHGAAWLDSIVHELMPLLMPATARPAGQRV